MDVDGRWWWQGPEGEEKITRQRHLTGSTIFLVQMNWKIECGFYLGPVLNLVDSEINFKWCFQFCFVLFWILGYQCKNWHKTAGDFEQSWDSLCHIQKRAGTTLASWWFRKGKQRTFSWRKASKSTGICHSLVSSCGCNVTRGLSLLPPCLPRHDGLYLQTGSQIILHRGILNRQKGNEIPCSMHWAASQRNEYWI